MSRVKSRALIKSLGSIAIYIHDILKPMEADESHYNYKETIQKENVEI